MSDGKILAPWTAEQVELLNEYQACGLAHPFTCGRRGDAGHGDDILVATESGWVCPSCEYRQSWALASMLNIRAFKEQLAEHPQWKSLLTPEDER